jgi:hypothetical protein
MWDVFLGTYPQAHPLSYIASYKKSQVHHALSDVFVNVSLGPILHGS